MTTLALLERILQLVSVAALAALLVRLRRLGVGRQYPWFTAMIGLNLAVNLGSFAVGRLTDSYAYYYFAATILICIAEYMVIREIYQKVLRDHGGLASFGKWVVYAAGAVALVASVGLVLPEVAGSDAPIREIRQSTLIRLMFVVQRVIVSALVFLVFAMTVFLAWFPVRVSRNTFLIWAGSTTLLFSQAVVLIARNLGSSAWTIALSAGYMFIETGCFLCWWRTLVPETVAAGRVTAVGLSRRDAEALIRQLDEINTALLRVSGK
ncbi:MAG: hypothetical protein R2762_21335 [Bryobacteraceae bacterium]